MASEERSSVISEVSSSDCRNECFHQDDDGGGGDGDEKQGSLRCRPCVLTCHLVRLGGDDGDWTC